MLESITSFTVFLLAEIARRLLGIVQNQQGNNDDVGRIFSCEYDG